MAYQALYRKFRPKTFDDVMGQEHITTTLKNQIKNNNIAHAYLFSGTRGTGKTSTAKVFARAVNCTNSHDGNPCNECEACKGILDETIMDVIEMDAASNTSVEDIRDLRERAKYPPSKCKYKVYIIDEVHMISKGASNALLKILEEPPKHLIFILATTEPQRLPATILSRCQRFDFKRITVKDIIQNMQNILDEIGIKADPNGLGLIARNSDGAMRDALSLLDQCLSFSEKEMTYEYILSILGVVNNDIIYEITDSIIEKNADKALELIEYIVQNGKDINQFIKDLILHFRNLMVIKVSDNIENILDETEEMIERLKKQAGSIATNGIINILKILSDAETQCKWSSQPRIVLEVSIIKMLNESSGSDYEDIVERIKKLEEKLENNVIIKDTASKKQSVSNNYIRTKATEKAEEEKQENTSNDVKESKDIIRTDIDINKVNEEWKNILKAIKSERIGLHALIMEGKPLSFKNGVLIIAFEDGFRFHKEAIEKSENKELVQQIINRCLNANMEVKFAMTEDVAKVDEEKQDKEQDKELIQQVIDVFGEELVEIEE
ncbi:DNA polymerase III subunit gamma/tau [Proteiniborus sp. MB09-C3]|uniref:DNA polymerase III subunit gamma/tau n=1 Tax=Proteiniborus sp. MB09-C3 TaxID=3050072 RepID=UPI0025525F1A|nr:DNA polymerase III subunit gamma/tau [Proteiniborus sp. MB09-C3]WIV12796.1 DNA polymerase III subunit gamma/tau [Proteiniborus sp. MB09-C3]